MTRFAENTTVGADRSRAEIEKNLTRYGADSLCNGSGFVVITASSMAHGCGGDENTCRSICPVPVPVQTQERCEYCARPCEAILAHDKCEAIRAQGEEEKTS